MILSKNFRLNEFTRSATALRFGIDNITDIVSLDNIKNLVTDLLQPLREKLGAIRITSGYRRPELCVAIGSKKTSQHARGEAVDIQFFKSGKMNNKLLMNTIVENFEFDQIINEFDYSWIHVSYKCEEIRNQILKAYKENGTTRYMDITHQYKSI